MNGNHEISGTPSLSRNSNITSYRYMESAEKHKQTCVVLDLIAERNPFLKALFFL